MPEINAVGDLVLTKAQEFAALSDPLALRLTDRLRRESPAEASALAVQLGAPEAEVEARLAELPAPRHRRARPRRLAPGRQRLGLRDPF
jgi:hypothetical protein